MAAKTIIDQIPGLQCEPTPSGTSRSNFLLTDQYESRTNCPSATFIDFDDIGPQQTDMLVTPSGTTVGHSSPIFETSSRNPQGDFLESYNSLMDLGPNWGGEDEIAPSDNILKETIHVACKIALLSEELDSFAIYPELSAGPDGEVGLLYIWGNKELCIEVYTDSDEIGVAIVMIELDSKGRLLKSDSGERHRFEEAVNWIFS